MAGPISNPLINDYVHRKYWGKAVALNGIGIILGEVGAMLLNFATTNVSYYTAFYITSLIICLVSKILKWVP